MFYHDSDTLCEYVKNKYGNAVILNFSGGKDSLATWLKLVEHNFTVYPIYYYTVPDLDFVEHNLQYVEKFFNTKITRIPNGFFWALLSGFWMQPTIERMEALYKFDIPYYEHEDHMFDDLRDQYGLTLYAANGVRFKDNVIRQQKMKRNGPIDFDRRVFYPIYNFSIDNVLAIIKKHKAKLPIDYALFGDSFSGIKYLYINKIKRFFPKDYEKIKFWFPLIESELIRYQFKRKYFSELHGFDDHENEK